MDPVREAYERLLERFGPQHWWPARSRFEVLVGAILMPQTAWANVESAIANLRAAGLLAPRGIASAPVARLRRLVRVAGLYRTKPERLRAMCADIVRRADADVDEWLDSRGTEDLRRDLLALDGVGPETADSILLYAAGRPVFVVDAYTRRVGHRLGWFRSDDYARVQRFFEDHLPRDAALFNEYHALLVRHGKALCRPRPRCPKCPLNRMCAYYRATTTSEPPPSGPRDAVPRRDARRVRDRPRHRPRGGRRGRGRRRSA